MTRSAVVLAVLSALAPAVTLAQPADPQPPQPPTVPTVPTVPPIPTVPPVPTVPPSTYPNPTPNTAPVPVEPTEEEKKRAKEKAKQPKAGDFDAGGQARFPTGPDEMDNFATYNWIAADLKGRYFLLDSITANGLVPLAVRKPENLSSGADPRMVGGIHLRLDAVIPKLPKMPGLKYDTALGLALGVAYMREGALLLGEKDYPLFLGDFKPGLTLGIIMKIKLSSVVDFNFNPVFIAQQGTEENITAIQVPINTAIKLGSLLKLTLELGLNTGDGYSLDGDEGGRIQLGAALTIKLGPIQLHTGAGWASLLTGGLYQKAGESLYVDLNLKYVK